MQGVRPRPRPWQVAKLIKMSTKVDLFRKKKILKSL